MSLTPDPDDRNGACEALEIDTAALARVRPRLSDTRSLHGLAEVFGALGDPTRLRILEALALEPLCVCDIASLTSVSASAVSHHLRTLRNLDLVTYERQGKRAVYRLADEHVKALLEQAGDHVAERHPRQEGAA